MLFLSYGRLLDLCEIRANKARGGGVELIGVVRYLCWHYFPINIRGTLEDSYVM
jgi:hypothetical protein